MPDHPFPNGAKLVSYLRDSGGRDQDLSVPQQEEYARRWCSEHGLILTDTFADIAKPGSTTAGRDDFDRMIRYFHGKPKEISGIIIWRWSRVSRDVNDSQFYRADLRRRGYEWYSLKDRIPSGPEGRLFESILDFHNQRYLEDLSEDIKRGLHYIVGQFNAFPCPRPLYGYRKIQEEFGERRDGSPRLLSRLEIDPEQAPTVVRAFKMRAEGATIAEIKKIAGLPGGLGSIRKILRSTLYLGVLEYGGETYEGFCEPIISRELWDIVQEVNKERSIRYGRNHPRSVRSRYLLSWLVRCGNCGYSLNASTMKRADGTTYGYYICGHYRTHGKSCGARTIPKEALENLVIERILSDVLSPEAVRALYLEAQKQAGEIIEETGENEKRLQEALRDTQNRINRITIAIAEMGHSTALLESLAGLEKRRDEIERELSTISGRRRSVELPDLTDEQLNQLAIQTAAKFESEDLAVKIEALRSLVVEIRAERLKDNSIQGKIIFVDPFRGGVKELCL